MFFWMLDFSRYEHYPLSTDRVSDWTHRPLQQDGENLVLPMTYPLENIPAAVTHITRAIKSHKVALSNTSYHQ
jgi:hypothetical protein